MGDEKMPIMIPGLNESLQFVDAPYIQNLVTKESCVAFVEHTLRWNYILMGISVLAVVVMFYCMWRMKMFNTKGREEEEEE